MPVKSYKDLVVWQKSFTLAKEIYSLTHELPRNEEFGLVSQIRRSAISVPSNIAEGQQRNNRGEYKQFIGVAKGSAAELETQLMLISEIYSIDVKQALTLLEEVQKMLGSLSRKLSLKPNTYTLAPGT
ncbi:four helix bundle protein [Candidatus Saccharibacteria bacterium]|nr:four helix bundle protein [Candidatus Saccharibacteria bacterium]